MNSFTAILVIFLFIGTEFVNCRVVNSDRDPRGVDTKAKRPFCNAFTGCGRKRSEGEGNEVMPSIPSQNMGNEEDFSRDGVTDLLELNSEPAIESLLRQIMSEAKMYEAIQEANREMFLQKMKLVNSANRSPSRYSMQK